MAATAGRETPSTICSSTTGSLRCPVSTPAALSADSRPAPIGNPVRSWAASKSICRAPTSRGRHRIHSPDASSGRRRNRRRRNPRGSTCLVRCAPGSVTSSRQACCSMLPAGPDGRAWSPAAIPRRRNWRQTFLPSPRKRRTGYSDGSPEPASRRGCGTPTGSPASNICTTILAQAVRRKPSWSELPIRSPRPAILPATWCGRD